MKFHLPSILGIVITTTSIIVESSAQGPPSNANANIPKIVRGQVKKWDVNDTDGNADIELYDNGPSISCTMKSVKGGKNNAPGKVCQSGMTAVTMVDADCPSNNNPFNTNGGGKKKKCFAASYVDAESGSIYHIDASGEVSETAEADYPDEEDPEDLDDGGRRLSTSRLLRGQTSLDINFDAAAAAKQQEHRELQAPVEIDVLVAYTQFALSSVGTRQQMTDLVNLAFAETNGAYAASGVNVVINLAHLHEDTSGYNIDQTDQSSMSPSLTALRSTTDGNLDYIHQMRIDYGADMVALITAGAGCGIAYLNSSYSTMFSVTRYSCATGYYSFGHELGHNMGAHHDRGTTGCNSGYNYGYRGETSSYRSILAYSCRTGQCDNNPYGGCTRLPFFSNPTLTYDGKNMGNSNTDNARVINENAPFIAGQLPPAGPVEPTNPPTPPPTSAPVPTNPPTTAAPTPFPTPPPTSAPIPTNPPTTAAPTTAKPTSSPTPLNCGTQYSSKGSCNDNPRCTWDGNPNTGNCISSGGGEPTGSPPTGCATCGNGENCCAPQSCETSGASWRRACV